MRNGFKNQQAIRKSERRAALRRRVKAVRKLRRARIVVDGWVPVK